MQKVLTILLCMFGLFVFANNDSLVKHATILQDTTEVLRLIAASKQSLNLDLDKSLQQAQKALAFSKKINFAKGEAWAYYRIGVVFYDKVEYSKSQFNFFKSLRICDSLDFIQLDIKVRNALGIAYSEMLEYDISNVFLQEAVSKCLKYNITALYPSILNNLGNNYHNTDQYLKAKTAYKEGLTKTDANTRPDIYNNLLLNLGTNYIYLNQPDSALYYFDILEGLYLEQQDSAGLGYVCLSSGVILEDEQKYLQAKSKYKKGLDMAQVSGDLGLEQSLLRRLIYSSIQLGDTSLFNTYFNELATLDEDILHRKTEEAIHDISIKYDVEKKEKDLLLSQMEKEELESKNQKNVLLVYLLIIAISVIVAVVFLIRKVNSVKQKSVELEVKAKNNQIENLIKEQEIKTYTALIEGQAIERKRIAEDLHDRIGGLLAAVKLQFEGDINLSDEKVKEVKSLINESIKTVRSVSHNLSDGRIDKMGLADAVLDLKNSLINSGNIQFDLFLDQYPKNIEINKEQELFKIILELLSNTLKHANASHIVLQINEQNNHVHFSFEDNGIGFDVNKKSNGIGMGNIEKRVQTLLGQWSVDSKPGHGTTVIIEFPKS